MLGSLAIPSAFLMTGAGPEESLEMSKLAVRSTPNYRSVSVAERVTTTGLVKQ